MDESMKDRVHEAALPMCEEFFRGAFSSVDAMDPQWNERGVDLYALQLLYAKTLFHFACFPFIATVQIMYRRLPEDLADEAFSVVLDMFTPVLLKYFLDFAALTAPEAKTHFRDEFVHILQLQITTYAKYDHVRGCKEFAILMSQDLMSVDTDLAKIIETFPPMIEAHAHQILPEYVKAATTFVDSVTAA